jgi:hypothetical protein
MAQGRRVRRVVRRIDTWSVFKVSALFYVSLALVLLLAGILLWAAGSTIGVIGSIEKFMSSIGFEDFKFVPSQLFRGFLAGGLVMVALGTGSAVLMAVVYNLISDVVGGIEFAVLEEDLRPAPATVAEVRSETPAAVEHRHPRAEEQRLAPGYPA